MKLRGIIIAAMILFVVSQAKAYWPETIDEQLDIAVDPTLNQDTRERAIPMTDGRTFIVWCETMGNQGAWIKYQIVDRYGEFQSRYPRPFLNIRYRRHNLMRFQMDRMALSSCLETQLKTLYPALSSRCRESTAWATKPGAIPAVL